ncbi:MAG: hypothetical protein O3B66_09020 [Actinomycetota bacterium]|nr:hypothetical protein [Actinomycetota bacterium]
MSRVSRRSLATRLAELRVEETLDDVFMDDLAARLQSLAVAASFEVGAKKGRLRRKFVAAIGSIGVIGWVGVTGAAASVGLATTGNLPAPVQDVVSTVFEVVGIDIPTSDENDPAPAEPVDDAPAVEVEEVPVESTLAVETTVPDETAPVETTIPEISDVEADSVVEEVPTPVTRPGNSGNTPAVTAPGQVGRDDDEKPSVTAPGQVGRDDDEKPSVTAPGQVGRDDEKPSVTAPGQVGRDDDSSNPGNSGDAPGQSGGAPGNSGNGNSSNAPGQATTSDDESSGPGKSGDAPGRNKKDDD